MLRLVTYNIRRGGSRRSHLIGEVLRSLDPDLIVLQEAVDPWVVGEVARTLGAHVTAAAPGRSVAILSRTGGLEVEWHRPPGGPRFAEVELPGIGARLLGMHLSAGLSGRGEGRRAREIEHVLAAARGRPGLASVLIAGDLNAIAPGDVPAVSRLPMWIRVLLRVDGGISTVVMERLLGAGFVDAYRRLNPSTPGGTIPSGAPSVRLDYFLVGPALMPCVVTCAIARADPTLLAAASDHLPLVLELEPPWRPAAELPS
jgi:endonuclease/exonuclease/phosphatase family metal-dependent hydrolase